MLEAPVRRGERIRHGDARPRRRRRDRRPATAAASCSRSKGSKPKQAPTAPLRLVLLRQRRRVAGRRRRLPAAGRRADLVGLPRLGRREQVPAVVGSWPAPFTGGYEGTAPAGRGRVRRRGRGVRRRSGGGSRAPASTIATGSPDGAIRVLVGPWATAARRPGRALRSRTGPQVSGVFARFSMRRRRRRAAGSKPWTNPGPPARRLRRRRRPGRGDPPLRSAADLGGHRLRPGGARRAAGVARRSRPARPLRGARRSRWRGRPAAGLRRDGGSMRSPFAYIPRPRPLQRGLAGRRGRLPRRPGRRRLRLLEPAGAGRRSASRRPSPAAWRAPAARCGRRCGWGSRWRC